MRNQWIAMLAMYGLSLLSAAQAWGQEGAPPEAAPAVAPQKSIVAPKTDEVMSPSDQVKKPGPPAETPLTTPPADPAPTASTPTPPVAVAESAAPAAPCETCSPCETSCCPPKSRCRWFRRCR